MYNNLSFPYFPMASISSIIHYCEDHARIRFRHGVKHRFVKRFEHYIYIWRDRDWWRIFRRGIIWLQRGGTKRETREEGKGREREKKCSNTVEWEDPRQRIAFFPPGKFIRRNATVAIFVLQISRDETRALNLCEKTINKYQKCRATYARFLLMDYSLFFSFLFFFFHFKYALE